MSAYKFPKYHTPVNVGKKIIVVGGGNTAIDCARAAVRLQKLNKIKSDTTVIYRRTEQEMPARRLEIEHAKEEGIKFNFLIKPQQFFADAKGFVRRLHCLRCELGEADESGRRKPIEIKGSDFDIECDLAIIAIGLKANEVLTRATAGLKTDASGDIVINPENMETSLKGVFAGGDIVGGEGTVIEAMGMAKKAAAGIINYIAQSK
jgi:glutamate synthase (NADPH/NADH) small chain